MADARVLVATARGDIACPNCSATQEHVIRIYYNDTTGALDVEKQCVCYSEDSPGTKYVEQYEATLVAK